MIVDLKNYICLAILYDDDIIDLDWKQIQRDTNSKIKISRFFALA
jgi:hypothetical protein